MLKAAPNHVCTMSSDSRCKAHLDANTRSSGEASVDLHVFSGTGVAVVADSPGLALTEALDALHPIIFYIIFR
jgi:hypothetical protein